MSTALAVTLAVVGALVALIGVLQKVYWLIPLGMVALFAGFLVFVRYRQHTPIYTKGRRET